MQRNIKLRATSFLPRPFSWVLLFNILLRLGWKEMSCLSFVHFHKKNLVLLSDSNYSCDHCGFFSHYTRGSNSFVHLCKRSFFILFCTFYYEFMWPVLGDCVMLRSTTVQEAVTWNWGSLWKTSSKQRRWAAGGLLAHRGVEPPWSASKKTHPHRRGLLKDRWGATRYHSKLKDAPIQRVSFWLLTSCAWCKK